MYRRRSAALLPLQGVARDVRLHGRRPPPHARPGKLHFASTLSAPPRLLVVTAPSSFSSAATGSSSISELEIVKRIRPKLSEIWRVYSSPEFRWKGYGLTEGGPISAMVDPDESCRLGSVGRLAGITEAKIVDHVSGEALSIGQEGELWVRGPGVMIGYVGDDESNALSFTSDGWLKTGDLCYFDGEGFLYIVDRLKELIKYKGYQVAPTELEHLIACLQGVVEVAVVPFPHEEDGEIPTAFIVREARNNLSEIEVMDYVAKQVAPYKKIRKVFFVSSIPKSPSGKVLRRELMKQKTSGFASRL
ncbi:4-coumarate--CoA ligase-like 7 [Ananas comosus]|uniref:4-coumarate--CoA ligase n=1 Tax=Ananas comosus TaxID=4615 RepID=A0A199VGS1_ANACO|nr:4-coumarate--CoA ligase-like 7 [Ananas comosus]